MDCIVCIDCDGLATLDAAEMQRELLYSVEAYLKFYLFRHKHLYIRVKAD